MARKKVPKTMFVTVVGMQHRLTMSTRRMLKSHVEEAPLTCKIEREPLNPADRNALMVVVNEKGSPYDGMHIGYVPRGIAEEYGPLVDKGEIVFGHAYLSSLDMDYGEGELTIKFKTAG